MISGLLPLVIDYRTIGGLVFNLPRILAEQIQHAFLSLLPSFSFLFLLKLQGPYRGLFSFKKLGRIVFDFRLIQHEHLLLPAVRHCMLFSV